MMSFSQAVEEGLRRLRELERGGATMSYNLCAYLAKAVLRDDGVSNPSYELWEPVAHAIQDHRNYSQLTGDWR